MIDALSAVTGVVAWLRTRAAGGAWPCPGEGGTDDVTLAWGPAGVALFLLRAYETLGDERLLADAAPGLATVAAQTGGTTGLYSGAAGRVYVLAEAYRVTGDSAYSAAAVAAAESLPPTTSPPDVYDGAAGAGLVLLDVAESLERPALAERAYDLAARVARAGTPCGDGLRWPVAGRPELPNFAHGTAGVAYFLAAAGQREAATAGGSYLLSLARRAEGRCEVPRTPGGDTYWPNWCNGPAGTVRLWSVLAPLDARFADARTGALRALASRLFPGGHVPDVADDTSLCCGSAGIHDALLDAVLAGEDEYVTAARRAFAHVCRCARDEAGALSWGRGRTGWLAGAAGTAFTLLRRGAYENGLPMPRPLPGAAAPVPAVVS